MNSSSLWFLCLLGVALLNQGWSKPATDDYVQDGDGEGDYDEGDYEDEESGPPPVIKSSPMTLEVDVGDVVFLPCDVEGNTKDVTRIWRKDNTGLYVGTVAQNKDPRINKLENGTLEIRQINASDSGTYSCMISVVGKAPEVAHTIRVKSPATITKITPSESLVSVKKTSSLTLECIAQGYPTPSIKWFRNGHVLEDQDPSIHGARYTIDNASMDDSGIYKCTATNGQQMPDEKIIEVQVNYPPEIMIPKAIVPTGEGYESELKCTVIGVKKPELKWYKDGEQKPIVPSSRIKMERSGHDHILRIIKTQQSDFGDYKCEAKNAEGESSAIIRLTGKPSQPMPDTAVTDEDTKNPVLIFNVESFAPIEEYELLYKKQENDEWVSLKPAVTPSTEGRIFRMKHMLTGLEPGVYEAKVKAKNNYGWSEFSSLQVFPKEHAGDLTETGLLAISESSAANELRISVALVVSLLVARFYC